MEGNKAEAEAAAGKKKKSESRSVASNSLWPYGL